MIEHYYCSGKHRMLRLIKQLCIQYCMMVGIGVSSLLLNRLHGLSPSRSRYSNKAVRQSNRGLVIQRAINNHLPLASVLLLTENKQYYINNAVISLCRILSHFSGANLHSPYPIKDRQVHQIIGLSRMFSCAARFVQFWICDYQTKCTLDSVNLKSDVNNTLSIRDIANTLGWIKTQVSY